jgi:peptidoglycan/xylan/chitin deacetylase (PgdA/CDA1 family)
VHVARIAYLCDMKTSIITSLFVLTATLAGHCLKAGAQRVVVAKYLDNKSAALSLTFDDGLSEHYTVVFPLLRRLGLRATFGLIGSRMGGTTSGQYKNIPCMTWEQAREMAAQGQEMTNHGYAHRNLSTLAGEEMRAEVQRNDTLIFSHTGVFPRTLIYPGNRRSEAATAFCERDRTCTRTRQVSLGGKCTEEWMDEYLRKLVADGGWGVTMTHAIANGYDHFEQPEVFTRLMEKVARMAHRLWIAPMRDVGAYVRQRDSVRLKVKFKRDRVIIRPTLKLDRTIYNMPLTILVDGKPYNIDPYRRKIVIR